jgi:hypothetical protein
LAPSSALSSPFGPVVGWLNTTTPAIAPAERSAWSWPKMCRKKVGDGLPLARLRRTVTLTALITGPSSTNCRVSPYQVPKTMSSSASTAPFVASGMFFSA